MNAGNSTNIPVNTTAWISYQTGNQNTEVKSLLTAGDHVIKITQREGGVGLDKILFTTYTQYIPAGIGDNYPSITDVPTLTPASPTVTPTIFVTATPEPTIPPSLTPTSTPVPTSTPTNTSTPSPTKTPTPSPTRTPPLTNTPTPTPTPYSLAGGLLVTSYNNSNFTGTSASRIDSSVNFNWAAGSPDPIINADTFSGTWIGYVTPKYNEKYTFYAKTADGVRLYVNGTKIIDNWKNQSANEISGTITLTAGRKYTIRMEYYENTGIAVAQLSWKSNSQIKQNIPQSRLSIN